MILDAQRVLRLPRRQRPLMREVMAFNQRWRRRSDGAVVVIRQLHRAEGVAEVTPENAAIRRSISFARLVEDFELLVDLRGMVR